MDVKLGKKSLKCSFDDNCEDVTLSLSIHRESYDGKTLGKMYVEKDEFGFTIEPTVRPDYIFVDGDTALISLMI